VTVVGSSGPDIDDVAIVAGDNTIQFYAEGQPVGAPLVIPNGLISGGTP
jgi:hypothetical protein